MEFFEVIEKRRSIRKYEQRSIEEEKIEKLIEAALRSPSSRGQQAWELVLVTDRDTIVDLSRAKEHGGAFLADAPLAIAVVADEEKCDVWVEDASIVCTFISLAAEALNLGSCWVQIRRRKDGKGYCAEENVRQILGLPASLRVEAIIAIGYPAEQKPPHIKDSLGYSKVSRNSYGQGKMIIKELQDKKEKKMVARRILDSLPEWFGIPEAKEEYIAKSSELPLFIASEGTQTLGFISVKENSPYTAEIYVMGVLPDYHKQGIGKALLARTLEWAKDKGYEFLQVKTLDESHPDPHYAATRKFYTAVGFKPLECLPELWDPDNPCLIMVMALA